MSRLLSTFELTVIGGGTDLLGGILLNDGELVDEPAALDLDEIDLVKHWDPRGNGALNLIRDGSGLDRGDPLNVGHAAALRPGHYADTLQTEFQREARSPALLTNLYQWKGASSFAIAGGDDSSTSVSVTVTVDLNHGFPGVGVMDFVGAPLPEQYKIFYSMHKEPSS